MEMMDGKAMFSGTEVFGGGGTFVAKHQGGAKKATVPGTDYYISIVLFF